MLKYQVEISKNLLKVFEAEIEDDTVHRIEDLYRQVAMEYDMIRQI